MFVHLCFVSSCQVKINKCIKTRPPAVLNNVLHIAMGQAFGHGIVLNGDKIILSRRESGGEVKRHPEQTQDWELGPMVKLCKGYKYTKRKAAPNIGAAFLYPKFDS